MLKEFDFFIGYCLEHSHLNNHRAFGEMVLSLRDKIAATEESSPSTLAPNALACGVCGRKTALVCTECSKNYMHSDVRR